MKLPDLIDLPAHSISLQIEKIFDVACTLTDVISCVPLESADSFEVGPLDYLNQFLNLISKLRGGDSRFLPLLLAKVSENLPSMGLAPMIHALPIMKQECSDESLSSPALSTPRSAPLMMPSPMAIVPSMASAASDPTVIFSGLSPSGPIMSPSVADTLTPLGTPKVAAQVPRSAPRIQFDGYFG